MKEDCVMKRLVMMILLCVLLAGCVGIGSPADSFETDAAMPGFDAQNQYMGTTTLSFQETDDFFCGSNFIGNYIQYYDKTSGVSGTLCADPACTHDSSDCGANMQAGATLSVYDGKLYWIAQDDQGGRDQYLWRSDLSGMDREKVLKISFEDMILTYQPQQYVIHRGNLYLYCRNSTVNGIESMFRVSLLSAPLSGSEEFTTIYDETFDCNVTSAIRFWRDYAFLSTITFPEDASSFHVTISKIELNSGKAEVVFDEANISEPPGTLWVTEEGELYLPGVDESDAYVWKLENNERIPIASASWTEGYPSVPFILKEAAVFSTVIDQVRYVRIVDLSGETLYDGKLFPEEIPGIKGNPNNYMLIIVGGDKEKLILNLQDIIGNNLVDYTVMLDITGNMKPTILWSSQS